MTSAAGSRLSEAMSKRIAIVVEHLLYEFFMLNYCFECLTSHSLDVNHNNVLIESFCLHARNLIDFFWGKEPASGDRPSADHFTDKEYPNHRGADPRGKAIYSKLNTQVAHLSYSRTSDRSKKISHQDRVELRQLVEPELAIFYAHLREPYRQALLDAQIASPFRSVPR